MEFFERIFSRNVQKECPSRAQKSQEMVFPDITSANPDFPGFPLGNLLRLTGNVLYGPRALSGDFKLYQIPAILKPLQHVCDVLSFWGGISSLSR